MFKLLKYELKARYNLLIGGSIAFIVANILLILSDKLNTSSDIANLIMSLPFLLIINAGMVAIIIDSVNILKKDLYNNTGYLLFTLPQRGYAILGAKLITILIEISLFGILLLITSIIQGLYFADKNSILFALKNINVFFEAIPGISYFLILLISLFFTMMLLIYFSLVLSKSIFNNKKFGGLISFSIFMVSIISWSRLNSFISKTLPLIVNFKNNNIIDPTMSFTINMPSVNITTLILNIVLIVGLFIGTSLLIEERVEM